VASRKISSAFDPKLILFLSADIVGSTEMKYKDAKSDQAEDKYSWVGIVLSFFMDFQQDFMQRWSKFKNSETIKYPEPSLWKTNGDEIIYKCEIKDHRQMMRLVADWKNTIEKFMADSTQGVKVKGVAWLAGFPVLNKEFVVFSGKTDFSRNDEFDDVISANFNSLEKFSKTGRDVIDYIGPSMDIGFRLGSQSTQKIFVVSVELAYFILNYRISAGFNKELALYYLKAQNLKGVLGEKSRYPIFYFLQEDGTSGDAFERAENAVLQKKHTDEELEEIINSFFDKNEAYLYRPFIYSTTSSEKLYKPTEKYMKALEDLRSKFERDKQRIVSFVENTSEEGQNEGQDLKDLSNEEVEEAFGDILDPKN